MGKVKLLTMWPSMFGMRCHIGLELKGVEYEYKEEDLTNKSKELLEANPIHKKIPVLIDEGKPVVESLVILSYIDEKWSSGTSFLPKDPYDRAVARLWADFGNKIYDAGSGIMRASGEEQTKRGQEFLEVMVLLDQGLGKVSNGKPFFGGEQMNYADIALVPFIPWFHAFEVLGGIKIPGSDKCPHLHRWIEASNKEHVVKKVLPAPEKVLEFAQIVRKRFVSA